MERQGRSGRPLRLGRWGKRCVNTVGIKEDGDYGSLGSKRLCSYLGIAGVKDGSSEETEKVDRVRT